MYFEISVGNDDSEDSDSRDEEDEEDEMDALDTNHANTNSAVTIDTSSPDIFNTPPPQPQYQ